MTDPVSDPSAALDYALAYARRGWRVVPVPPKAKHPSITAWQTEGSTDVERIKHWWGASSDFGIGIVTGAESGLVVLDVDEHGHVRGSDTLADLEATYERLPDTLEVLTGGGGRHLYFAHPGHEVRNDAGRRLGPGLDVRGDGGQVIAPPSMHASGQRYEFELSSGWPDRVLVAPLPGWLDELLSSSQAPAPTREVASNAGYRPGDRWSADTSWYELLTDDGATFMGERVDHVDGSTYQLWSRPALPGEQFSPHTSGTVNYRDSNVLKVFSSQWMRVNALGEIVWQLDEGATYTKFGYYAATRHSGDHRAASAALEAMGYEALENPDDRAANLISSARDDIDEQLEDEDWPDTIPLDLGNMPSFPLDALPDVVAARALEVADELSVPVDMPAMFGLGALATLCQGHVRLQVSGSWREHVNLYLVVGAPSGIGKSPALRSMFAPVHQLEALVQTEQASVVAANRDRIDVLEAQLKRAKSAAEPDFEQINALSAKLLLARQERSSPTRLSVGDITPEQLAVTMAANDGRISVVSSEGGPFAITLGRYSSNPALEIYLQGFTGDRVDVQRISRDDVFIAEAVLSMVLAVQPKVLHELGSDSALVQRGFTARFAYSMLGVQAGVVPLRWAEGEPSDVELSYVEQLVALGRWLRRSLTPRPLPLSREAFERINDWRMVTLQRAAQNERELLDVLMPKLLLSVLRSAALIGLTRRIGDCDSIGFDDACDAVKLGDYWVAHGLAAAHLWTRSAVHDDAIAIMTWARRNDRDEITKRDLYTSLRARFPRVDDIDEPLALLIERGWVRELVPNKPNKPARGRPPAPRFAINPVARRVGSGIELAEVFVPLRNLERSLSLSLSFPPPQRERQSNDQVDVEHAAESIADIDDERMRIVDEIMGLRPPTDEDDES